MMRMHERTIVTCNLSLLPAASNAAYFHGHMWISGSVPSKSLRAMNGNVACAV